MNLFLFTIPLAILCGVYGWAVMGVILDWPESWLERYLATLAVISLTVGMAILWCAAVK